MNKDYIRISELISRKLQDQLSPDEYCELTCLIEKYPELQSWLDDPDHTLSKIRERLSIYRDLEVEQEWQVVLEKLAKTTHQRQTKSHWWAIAASIVGLFIIGGGLLWKKNATLTTSQPAIAQQVTPGKSTAFLTLSDGSTVELGADGAHIIKDGIIQVSASGSTLDYRSVSDMEVQMHKLAVPIGGTFHIQLADGTDVWLNADSELTFPSVFVGDERRVQVRGEAYFDIAKDPHRPFLVEVGDTQVEALGTAFNINTHLLSGKTKTILVQGMIKVSSNGNSKIIHPGYGTISGQGNIQVEKSDTEEALAWKEGYFYFDSKSLKEVLEEIARWYNVDVEIRTAESNNKYKGGIKKTESIQAVCAILQDLTGYKVNVENNKIIVKPLNHQNI